MAKVVDVFPFYNEVDLLELRLETVQDVVDHFVLIEAPSTFSGRTKPLYFQENSRLFAKYQSRISVLTVSLPQNSSPFEREWHQLNAVKEYLLQNFDEDDVILWGDVDEIPNPELIVDIEKITNCNKIAYFAQRMFYYYINCEEVKHRLLSFAGEFSGVRKREKRWLGTKAIAIRNIGERSMIDLRSPGLKQSGIRLANGGWHFSFCGGLEPGAALNQRVLDKVGAYSHQELVTREFLDDLPTRLKRNQDLFGRRGPKFKIVTLNDSFPRPLLMGNNNFGHMIAPTSQS